MEGINMRLKHKAASAALALTLSGAALGQAEPDSAPATTAPAQTAPRISTDATENGPAAPQFLRVSEVKGKSIALDVASHTLKRPDGSGPEIALVGVVHIGDRAFYRAMQTVLDRFDVVLYESVKPAGTGGAGGATDEERIESTRSAMKFVGSVIESFRAEKDRYPESLNELHDFAAAKDPRTVQFLRAAQVDAWGRSLVYDKQNAPSNESPPQAATQADENAPHESA